MSTDGKHIEQWRLEAWVCGELLDHESAEVEAHLEVCEQCAELLESTNLPNEDSFVKKLRDAGSHGEPLQPVPSGRDPVIEPATFGQQAGDPNLLFGVLAVQTGAVERHHFLDACMLWASRKGKSLAEILLAQGWMDKSDLPIVQKLLDRRLEKEAPLTPPKPQDGEHDTSTTSRQGTVIVAPIADLHDKQRIRLKELHSTGGIGQVWLARDEVLGRDLALKELLPEHSHSSANRERFYREAQITAQLGHPGTVPVHQYYEEHGRTYYTMKFLRGKVLTEAIAECHELAGEAHFEALVNLLDNFVSICNTIAYAHSRNVIHRDLKGDNVMIGAFGEVTVLDWGLAKKLPRHGPTSTTKKKQEKENPSSSPTVQGERLGTPAFMAPEQARGEISDVDFRTDVYGLAAILYEILSGKVPFSGGTVHQVMHRVETESPVSPSEFNPMVPSRLEAICMRGLSKERESRQQTAEEMRDAVKAWIMHQVERERKDQTRERFFSLSHDLLAILNHRSRIEHLNPAWEEITGYSTSELIGKMPWDVLHEDDHDFGRWVYQNLKDGKRSLQSEARVVCKDGSIIWILWNLVPIPGERKVYAVGREITELKSAETVHCDIIKATPLPLIACDTEGNITIINDEVEQLFGYSRWQVIGKPLTMLIPEFDGAADSQSIVGKTKTNEQATLHMDSNVVETHSGLLRVHLLRRVEL